MHCFIESNFFGKITGDGTKLTRNRSAFIQTFFQCFELFSCIFFLDFQGFTVQKFFSETSVTTKLHKKVRKGRIKTSYHLTWVPLHQVFEKHLCHQLPLLFRSYFLIKFMIHADSQQLNHILSYQMVNKDLYNINIFRDRCFSSSSLWSFDWYL